MLDPVCKARLPVSALQASLPWAVPQASHLVDLQASLGAEDHVCHFTCQPLPRHVTYQKYQPASQAARLLNSRVVLLQVGLTSRLQVGRFCSNSFHRLFPWPRLPAPWWSWLPPTPRLRRKMSAIFDKSYSDCRSCKSNTFKRYLAPGIGRPGIWANIKPEERTHYEYRDASHVAFRKALATAFRMAMSYSQGWHGVEANLSVCKYSPGDCSTTPKVYLD